jgi:uncharacterized protein (DUF3820 family)
MNSEDREVHPDKNVLLKLAKTKIPFGKYKGFHLVNLPGTISSCFPAQVSLWVNSETFLKWFMRSKSMDWNTYLKPFKDK